jgi:hypothetical protein
VHVVAVQHWVPMHAPASHAISQVSPLQDTSLLHVPSPLQEMVVSEASLSMDPVHAPIPEHVIAQALPEHRMLFAQEPVPQVIPQWSLALQRISPLQAVSAQVTSHDVPAQRTRLPQEPALPHWMSQLAASRQSISPPQASSPHSTRHGTPAGHTMS